MSDSLDAYLILSGLLFAIGSFGFLARRNAISMLMSIELMLNAVNLTIIAFGSFVTGLAVKGSVIVPVGRITWAEPVNLACLLPGVDGQEVPGLLINNPPMDWALIRTSA